MPKIPTSGVYLITNEIAKKVYVGSSSLSVKRRCADHLLELRKGSHANRYLQRAWDKDGEHNFTFSVLELCSSANCLKREQHWIDYYFSATPEFGYNICPNAGSQLGFRHSEETKRKLSLINQARDPEIRKRQGDKLRGRKHTSEHKAKISANNIGKHSGPKHSDEAKAKISAWQKGRKKSDAFRENLVKIRTGWKLSEETKAKIGDKHRGKKRGPLPEETRQKLSIALKVAWEAKRKVRQ